jgi:hypothetical protein
MAAVMETKGQTSERGKVRGKGEREREILTMLGVYAEREYRRDGSAVITPFPIPIAVVLVMILSEGGREDFFGVSVLVAATGGC